MNIKIKYFLNILNLEISYTALHSAVCLPPPWLIFRAFDKEVTVIGIGQTEYHGNRYLHEATIKVIKTNKINNKIYETDIELKFVCLK